MQRKKKGYSNNNLFAVVVVIIAIVLLAVGAFLIIKEKSKDNKDEPSPSSPAVSSQSGEDEEEPSVSSKTEDPESEPQSKPESKPAHKGDKDEFFENSVFIGDSVMLGFKNYCNKKGDDFLGGAKFLASGSYAVRLALDPVSEDSLHPLYNGEQHQVWDSVKMMGAEKVFICLGINDVAINGVDGTVTRYDTLINKIKETNPKADVYVMSTTFCCKGGEKGKLNNENLAALNKKMKEYCKGGNAEFIDIMSKLDDGNGYLAAKYCSDDYIHQTTAAYDIWVSTLRDFAAEK